MTGFHVLDGGLQTVFQDAGRRGLLAVGVPHSGALDILSWRLANRLVHNEEGDVALELRSPGPVLRLDAPAARIALTGSSAGLSIERGGEVQEWPSWRAIDLEAGDIVRIVPFADTAVAYLAVRGGFAVPDVLGSRATFLRGGFGGIHGRALQAGDDLSLVNIVRPDVPCLVLLTPPQFMASPILRVIEGPQADHFTDAARATFLAAPFTVTRDLDRMGIRLDGPVLEHSRGADIVSDATVPGAIQVPGSGHPILLLNDCQTTGGYPKIATVISADLAAAGRLVPGAQIRFRKVSLEEADTARADAAKAWQALSAMIVPVRE